MALHSTTSATPAGDKLFVELYDGEMGEFRVGPELDVMIRRLYDTENGNKSLDPIATIADSSGVLFG